MLRSVAMLFSILTGCPDVSSAAVRLLVADITPVNPVQMYTKSRCVYVKPSVGFFANPIRLFLCDSAGDFPFL